MLTRKFNCDNIHFGYYAVMHRNGNVFYDLNLLLYPMEDICT